MCAGCVHIKPAGSVAGAAGGVPAVPASQVIILLVLVLACGAAAGTELAGI